MNKMLIKPNQSKKIFELLKEGYEITMQTLEDVNKKESYVIFYKKTDKYGDPINNEEKTDEEKTEQ